MGGSKLQALVYDILPSTMEEGTGKRCSECDQYPNLSESADRVGGQLRGDKECPFSGVTKSGRVWRKVPESDARSVERVLMHAGRFAPTRHTGYPSFITSDWPNRRAAAW